MLGEAPPWLRLGGFQNAITRDEFLQLLDEVYAPGGAYADWIVVHDDHAHIRMSGDDPESEFILRFTEERKEPGKFGRYWRRRDELPPALPGKPLSGIRIAIDPGHIGGEYARIEQRSFEIAGQPPVREGDLTLKVARMLEDRLAALGAEVILVRSAARPSTRETSESLMPAAVEYLQAKGKTAEAGKQAFEAEASRLSELLFYRVSEIHARAERINHEIKPDIVLAVHFNAAAWPPGDKHTLIPENHFHVLVNGAYSADEIALDDVRYLMAVKLLTGTAAEEIALTEDIAETMAEATALPPFAYSTPNAIKVGDDPYVWARNLLANRIYQCPVVYLEPYVMNSVEDFERIQAGDYDGERKVAGKLRKSIFREYADGVTEGLLTYYRGRPEEAIPE